MACDMELDVLLLVETLIVMFVSLTESFEDRDTMSGSENTTLVLFLEEEMSMTRTGGERYLPVNIKE